ncbi:MAG: hypothetical protein GXP31_10360 [Kiritimatiellaeota bacterium]|nr:hypothetical protein [Kiritimatiellota bacterium]
MFFMESAHAPRTALLFAFCVCGAIAVGATAARREGIARYDVGQWPEPGRGNHRVLVRVEKPADAVRVHIPWRRRDPHPERKAVHVFPAGDRQPIRNVAVLRISNLSGDLVFQPSGPGLYEVYFLPFRPPPGSGVFGNGGQYDAPETTADPAWLKQHGLADDGAESAEWRNLPEATVVEIQARGDFHRMDPMEVIAGEGEVQALLERFPDRPVLLFPEDRRRPIKMFETIPYRWAVQGPKSGFSGKARPGEFYVFQVGVWACRRSVNGLDVRFEPLHGPGGRNIPAAAFRCFNLGGVDFRGRPFRKKFALARGRVRALWIGVQVPGNTRGTYSGRLVVAPEDMDPIPLDVRLDISGPRLADAGDGDLWRMARLRWLDSTLGIDDDVVPPYTPLTVDGNTVGCLGRTVRFGLRGLPKEITSFGQAVLAGPVAFRIETERGEVKIRSLHARWTKKSPVAVEREVRTESPELDVTTHVRMEFDGCLLYRITLEARRETALRDVRLDVPLRAEIAQYMMGMNRRGGYRPKQWEWKWNIERADNMVWLGNAGAGLQLKLAPDKDVWAAKDLRGAGLPAGWSNSGRGGCRIREESGSVLVQAFSGPRRLKAGERLTFRFRFLVTPFHSIDPKHWNWRNGDVWNGEANVLHVHHGTPPNPYINYPFLRVKELKALVEKARADRHVKENAGRLEYPAEGNIRLDRGALHVWVRIRFDPREGKPRDARYNQSLFYLDFPDRDQIGFYWNVDDRGMRAYLRRGPPSKANYPVLFGTHSPKWRIGQRHLLTLSWGKRMTVAMDGEVLAAVRHTGTLSGKSLDAAVLRFKSGGFGIDAIKITDVPYTPGVPVTPTVDEHTLLLDTFSRWNGGAETAPEKCASGANGRIVGVVEKAGGRFGPELRFSYRRRKLPPAGVNIYYTVRELSNHTTEMWALRSLGSEVFKTDGVDIFTDPTPLVKPCKGYSWLREHLLAGYETAWRVNFGNGDFDAAIQMQPLSRWHNYYVEGLRWLMENTGVDGLYLDGIGYDRGIMQRVARVMRRLNPQSRIDFHSGDSWSPPWDRDRHLSAANKYMEHLPYINSLWFGELFDYNGPPDYWLVEISGIPFGLTGEMLEYRNGGNPYRGMIYGMVGRLHPSKPALWRLWDAFGIQQARMIGYWDKSCPVRTDTPGVLATVYAKPDQVMVALAHWPQDRGSRRVVAPQNRKLPSPVIDGRLAPGEWQQAARLTRFQPIGQDTPAEARTEVLITWDAAALYIGFRCSQPPGVRPKADVVERDGPVWTDDAVELFFQPNPKSGQYFQFVGNSRGAFADCAGMERSWNGAWTYRTAVEKDAWTGEVRVPWSTFDAKFAKNAIPNTIGFNACRDRQTPHPELSSWSPVSNTFHEPEHFGRVELATADASPTREPLAAQNGGQAVRVRLKIDWKALGLDPRHARCVAPAIDRFQESASFEIGAPIPIEPSKGRIVIFDAQD